MPMGYGRVRTVLPDAVCGPGGKGAGLGDLAALKPTVMAGVPMVWERIRKGMHTKVAQKGALVESIFNASIWLMWHSLTTFGPNPLASLLNKTVFALGRKITGGRLRIGICGGAAVSDDTVKFISSTLCILLQGYGMTEISGVASVVTPDLGYRTGTVGLPFPGLDFRLIDVPDAGYYASENCGELWLRGPSVTSQYYENEAENKSAFAEGGWFKTGDVIRFNEDGTMSIIDRIRNLVKLQNGEYLAVEKLEAMYRDSGSLKNICIIADSSREYLVAVVEPADDNVTTDEILSSLRAIAAKNALSKIETVRGVYVSRGEEWMTNGYLTTTGKLKRKVIYERLRHEIEDVYRKSR
ncbi:uncharacterized protein VTP21DRAFT_100 [Calcarisporiella thermophila]|uniref:uncharacterized protein n=1 Tax=Calcarisporiella thermophila TaxID=911321 RepID=UPI003742689A